MRYGANFMDLKSVMGNYAPAKMNTYQEYLGTPNSQRMMHYNNIQPPLRSNFYV